MKNSDAGGNRMYKIIKSTVGSLATDFVPMRRGKILTDYRELNSDKESGRKNLARDIFESVE
jgi:hypothetical protein